ncbi:MAG: hypothetical protein JNK72_04030 [Myxococcales bacterium]|nr:hypothetical protein [Myxococcales bacterium]
MPTQPPARRKTTSHRPLTAPRGGKRALVQLGGDTQVTGDPALAEALASAFSVEASHRDATLTHPFHAYPARLHPEITRRLLGVVAPAPGSTVFDPFCGSGTVLVEAMAAGHRAVGRDLSPLAVALARVKTAHTSDAERKAIVAQARRIAGIARDEARSAPLDAVPAGEARWYRRHTQAELVTLLRHVGRVPPGVVRDALTMLISSVLVKVSFQASETDPRRVEKEVGPGLALRLFAFKAEELSRGMAAFARALGPVRSARTRADLALDDAGALATVPDASVDAVVTSPPYANTYDYVDHHARRYAWLGLDAGPMMAKEMGASRWFAEPAEGTKRFQRELDGFAAALGRVLKPGGVAALVIADGAANGQRLAAEVMVASAARSAGLTEVARASQPRKVFDPDSAAAFREVPKREHVIVVRKR